MDQGGGRGLGGGFGWGGGSWRGTHCPGVKYNGMLGEICSESCGEHLGFSFLCMKEALFEEWR